MRVGWIAAGPALGVLLLLPTVATPAPVIPEGDGVRCNLDSGTQTLDLVIEQDPTYLDGTTDGSVSLHPSAGTIEIEGGDGGHSVVCTGGTPTTTNVDTIRITKAADVRAASVRLVQAATERFAPGATAEPDGSSEIEIEVDVGSKGGAFILLVGAHRDRVDFGGSAGSPAANLNADEALPDADVVVAGGFLGIRAGGGDDILRSRGVLPGFDGSYPGYRQHGPPLFGEGGDDLLIGSALRDSIVGLAGHDRIRAGEGSDHIYAADDDRDSVHCGRGDNDKAELDPQDDRRSCEGRIPA